MRRVPSLARERPPDSPGLPLVSIGGQARAHEPVHLLRLTVSLLKL